MPSVKGQPVCLFTIQGQVTADPKTCVRKVGGRKLKENEITMSCPTATTAWCVPGRQLTEDPRKYRCRECPTGTTAWCVPGRHAVFGQQSPATAFCERTACVFTVLEQLTADAKNCLRLS
jgi:hypothetical protein